MMNLGSNSQPLWLRLSVAILIVAAAAWVRMWFLENLGLRAPYLTFYPAVALAALYSGFLPGILATLLSALLTSWLWLEPVGNPFEISDPADLLSMGVFIVSCVLVCFIAEAMHRARRRADASEERERNDLSRREREENFRVMANAIPQLAWIAKGDGYIFWYNDRWYEYTGVTPEQMEGWGWQSVHDPEVLPSVLEKWKLSIATGKPFEMIFPLRGADGVFRPFLTRVNPMVDADGRVVQWFGTNTDVSEQQRLEEELRLQAEKLTFFIEHVPASIAMFDHQMRYVAVSTRWREDFGLEGVELIGLNHYDVFPDTPERWKEIHRRCLAGAVEKSNTDWFDRADGRPQWVRWEARPWNAADGSIGGIVIFSEDITERKLLEEQLQEKLALLDLAPVLVRDMEDRITMWNSGAQRLYGFSPEETLGRLSNEVLRTVFPSPMSEIRETLLDAGTWAGELRHATKDGRTVHVSSLWVLQRDKDGRPQSVLEVNNDITPAIQAYAQAHEMDVRFRSFMDNSPTIAWVKDADGHYVFINKCYEKQFGVSAQDWLGKTDFELWPRDTAEEFRRNDLAVLAQNGVVNATETTHGPDGTPIYWNNYKFPIPGPSGEFYVGGIGINVTQQTLLSRKLEAVNESLSLALDAARAGTWEWDLPTNANVWSDQLYDLYGLDKERARPEYDVWLQSVHPDHRDTLTAMLMGMVSRGESIEMEWRVNLPDDQERWLFSRGRPASGADGRPTSYRGIVLDVTERVIAERKQREVDAKLNAALESMTDAVFISDVSGRFINFNEAFALFHKFNSKDECLKTLAEYPDVLEVYFEDGELAPLDQWAVPRALRGETAYNEVYSLRRKDTGVRWTASYSFSPIRDQSGEIVGSVVVGRDITDRKKTEEQALRWQRVFENAGFGLALARVEDNLFLSVNPAFARERGYKTDELAGRPLLSVYPENLRAAVRDEILRIDATGHGVFESEHMRKDGTVFPVLMEVTVLKDLQGRPVSRVAYALDITNLKQAERQLREQADDLRRSNSELEQFAYVASHDLQEPLRKISSFMELLSRRYRGKLDSDADEFIGFAVDAAKRMKDMIEDLLAYSRVSSRGREFAVTEMDMVVDLALSDLQLSIEESGATIIRTPLPIVLGDSVQLQQLMRNLVGNAIKYRSKADPIIQIKAEMDSGKWIFSVTDNGIGIASVHRERIFKVFQRLHGPGKYPGTGIGLAVCRKIVERHGGHIWVEDAPGGGSSFRFTVPQVRSY